VYINLRLTPKEKEKLRLQSKIESKRAGRFVSMSEILRSFIKTLPEQKTPRVTSKAMKIVKEAMKKKHY
jgi:Arc/MetJ-type ribon-helix-helix transcriptional regulator